ncbi:MAG: class I SAM-dependent methyltransferase [Chlorobi bacterium]|nr:class I SAM-dependent methyltransferase [Chlorobiota bacterium]
MFEFEDLSWFPDVIRRCQTDYLHFVISKFEIYKPAVPLVKEVIDKTGTNEIIDLCSGGGGGTDVFHKNPEEITGKQIKMTLSDKYPNLTAFEQIKTSTGGKVDYIKESVDALNVPQNIKAMRTLFSSFHHFKPEDAKSILKSAVTNEIPIAVFEGAEKSILNFLGILLLTPLTFIIITPFIKPFRLSRIFFTYLIPLIPLTTVWDGLVSVLRMYSPNEMLKMAMEVDSINYKWSSGKVRGKIGNAVLYLVGYPVN